MIGLFTLVVRAVLLAGFTFAFVVLYEHGPQGFVAGVPIEAKHLSRFAMSLSNRADADPAPSPTPKTEPVPAVPAPTQAPSQATPTPKTDNPPSAWQKLQSTPIGGGMELPVGAPSN